MLEIPVSQKFKYLGFAAWQQQNLVQSWGVFCSQTKFHMSTGIFMREISPMVIIFSPCCCLEIATYFKDSWMFQGTWSNISGALFLFCFEGILLEAFVNVWSHQAVTNLEANIFSLVIPPASFFPSTQGWSSGWPDGTGPHQGKHSLLLYFHQEALCAVQGMLNVYLPDGIFSHPLSLCSAFTGLLLTPHGCLQKHHQALSTAEDMNRVCTLLTASLCGTAFLSFIKMGVGATPAQCLCKGSPSSHNYCCLNDSQMLVIILHIVKQELNVSKTRRRGAEEQLGAGFHARSLPRCSARWISQGTLKEKT